MTNNELLLSISNLLDNKLDARLTPIENRLDRLENRLDSFENRLDSFENRLNSLDNEMKYVRVNLLENDIIPRLSTIESCYTSTFERYNTNP